MSDVIMRTDMPGIAEPRRGKVRDIYDLGKYLLLVVSDRVSAFDVILPTGIPGKGMILTKISEFWFRSMEHIVKHHLISTDVKAFPKELRRYAVMLEGRSMLVKKAKPLPVECIVRGYLSGSGWKEYREKGTVCDIALKDGLQESARLDTPIFTPSTKAAEGHDENIPFSRMQDIVGAEMAGALRDMSLRIYAEARDLAESKGIIIADTKFEFGLYEDKLILIDELLTPDSSRFWSVRDYMPGKGQDSYDKQIIRDYLLTLDWDRTYPGPALPDHVVDKAAQRYDEIFAILTG